MVENFRPEKRHERRPVSCLRFGPKHVRKYDDVKRGQPCLTVMTPLQTIFASLNFLGFYKELEKKQITMMKLTGPR